MKFRLNCRGRGAIWCILRGCRRRGRLELSYDGGFCILIGVQHTDHCAMPKVLGDPCKKRVVGLHRYLGTM